jgi:uncharacterized protein (DUF885 family)
MTTPSEQFAQLVSDHWEAWMRWDPLFATSCGDQRYNDRLPGAGEEHYVSWRGQLQGFLRRMQGIERGGLSAEERLNFEILKRLTENEIAELGFPFYRLLLNKTGSFQAYFPVLHQQIPLDTEQDYENYISRLEELRRYFDESMALMRLGLQEGIQQAGCALEGVESSIQPHIVSDPQASIFYQPFKQFPASIPDARREALSKDAQQAVMGSVVPAYQALLEFLVKEYRPAARTSVGIAALKDGEAFYRSRIRYFTSLDLDPETIHATGQDEVRRIRAEMEAVISKMGFAGDLGGFIQHLRSDPQYYVTTPQALMEKAALVAKRMDGELPRLFKTLPRLPYGIREIPAFNAPGNTTAFYQPGAGDGTIAGYYYVNTYDLKSRPLYELEALTLHEAVPGHHLQIALQQELDLPNFRRFSGFTAFVEGWALYSERLGLETGFYQDPASDFGRLSYEMWRATRLVVDTGLHVLGWGRQQAIDFMAANTSLTLLNIANEVDRYISWPGQALAYKIGELKLRELRGMAEKELGTKFNLRAFHDVVLLAGAVPLDVLEGRVKEWVAGQ